MTKNQILKTSLRRLQTPGQLTQIIDTHREDIDIEAKSFFNETCFIMFDLCGDVVHVEIPQLEMCYILQESELIDDYDLSSGDVHYQILNHTGEQWYPMTATIEQYFMLSLDNEQLKDIIFIYAELNS